MIPTFPVGTKVRVANNQKNGMTMRGFIGMVGEVIAAGDFGIDTLRVRGLPSVDKALWLDADRFELAYPVAESKPSNPKAAIGASKLALNFVPNTLGAYAASAFYEGASKYGAFNWRVAGVQASTYTAACKRHIDKWIDGQDFDPKTRVHHLANAIACLTIILDAELAGKLTDDRPPKVDLDGLHERLAATQKHLTEMHKDMKPVHCYEDKTLSL